MATVEELLASAGINDHVLTIDLNTRKIIVPNTLTNLGVESDDDVKRVYFQIPKQYGEFDLSTFDIRINYMNAGKHGGIYVSDDVSVDKTTGIITFSWLVDRHVVEYAGTVTFNVCMKLLGTNGIVIKEFNTTTANLPVLTGLETEESVVEDNPSIFDSLLARLYKVEEDNKMGPAITLTRGGNMITITERLNNGNTDVSVLVLDGNGRPIKIIEGAEECDVSWEGF